MWPYFGPDPLVYHLIDCDLWNGCHELAQHPADVPELWAKVIETYIPDDGPAAWCGCKGVG